MHIFVDSQDINVNLFHNLRTKIKIYVTVNINKFAIFSDMSSIINWNRRITPIIYSTKSHKAQTFIPEIIKPPKTASLLKFIFGLYSSKTIFDSPKYDLWLRSVDFNGRAISSFSYKMSRVAVSLLYLIILWIIKRYNRYLRLGTNFGIKLNW